MNILAPSKSKLNYSCIASSSILQEYQLLNTPLGNFDTSFSLIVQPAKSIRSVLLEMELRACDAAVVVDASGTLVGIFTKSDLLSRIVIPCIDLDEPIVSVMTANPVTLQTKALGYEAVVAMIKGGFHHVVLMEDGHVTGVVSEHDLFTLQQVSFGRIAATINSAEDLEKVQSCAMEIKSLVEYLFMQGVAPDQVTLIVSTLNDQLIRRVIDIETAAEDLRDVRICWVTMGSEGRYEQTISTDQDNAIIFEHSRHTNPERVRKILLPIAARVNRALDFIGFPLCKGNVMASNPECCLSLKEWKKKFDKWIHEPTPESLLNINIYFDFRVVHGQCDLADELRIWLCDAVRNQKRFLTLMADVALQKSPPLSFFNNFIQENHPEAPRSTDIKVRGITVFVDAARIYALACGIMSTRTHDRLTLAGKARKWTNSTVSAWTESFSFLQGIRIRHQHHLQNNGKKANNRLDLCNLNAIEQKVCTEAFKQAGKLQKQLELDFIREFMANAGAGA